MDPRPLAASPKKRRHGRGGGPLRSTARGIWKVFLPADDGSKARLTNQPTGGNSSPRGKMHPLLHGDAALCSRTKHRLHGCAVFYSHEGAIARPEQELRIDQPTKQIRARG